MNFPQEDKVFQRPCRSGLLYRRIFCHHRSELMPITPFCGPFLGFKMSRNRGKNEESGGEKDK